MLNRARSVAVDDWDMSAAGQTRRFRDVRRMSDLRLDCVAKPGRFVGDCSLEFGVLPCSALPLRELQHQGVGRVGQGNC